MGGDTAGEVTGRGAGDGVEAELPSLGGGDADDPVLEGVGGVAAVILDIEVVEAQLPAQVVGFQQRCESGAQIDDVAVDREKVLVAPHGKWPGLHALPIESSSYGIVVVDDFDGAEAPFAYVHGVKGVFLAALFAS